MKYDDYIERHAPRLPVVFLRLYLGFYFLYRAVTFFTSGTVGREVFNQQLQQLLSFRQIPVLGAYFRMIAGIRTELLASALLAVFLMAGISLVLGLHVRLFGVLAWLYLLHRYFLGYLGPSAVDSTTLLTQHTLALRLNEALMVGILVVVWTSAGRTWGVDGLVWRRRLKREFAYPSEPEPEPEQTAGQDEEDPLPTEPTRDK